jgi:predicted nucleotidyltransferase
MHFFLHISKKCRIFAAEIIIFTIMPSAEVQKLIPQIQAYFATQPVERAYLFGSCSRGEERPDSDVDLLVTYTDSDKISLMDIGGMVSDLRKIVHRPVDLIEDDYLMPFARKTADRDKIKIYERAY